MNATCLPVSLMLLLTLGFPGFGCGLADADDETGGDPSEVSPPAHLDPGVPPLSEGTWYRPALGVTWQWQLQGDVNTSYDVELYDLDLFETPDAVFRELHDQGRKVICYFSAGSGENYRPDYDQFLASDLGFRLDGYEDERWLDIRSQTVINVMEKRLDLAVRRGCDGVEPDNVTAYDNDTGFDLTEQDQLAFNRHLANEAHERGLSIALKNDGDQAEELVAYFDFELNEECHEYEECEQLQVFTDHGKPILNAEYADNLSAAQEWSRAVCPAAAQARIQSLVLPRDLDDSFRVACP